MIFVFVNAFEFFVLIVTGDVRVHEIKSSPYHFILLPINLSYTVLPGIFCTSLKEFSHDFVRPAF